MSDRSEHVQMVADCEARESKLSDWERTFIDSISKQMETPGFQLSTRQEETLDKIWEKVT